jgi:6,7-dimethyl-8-ribityllumazine synthase
MPEFTGLPSGVGRRIVVVASRFVKKLVDGAMEALVKYGVAFDDIDVVWVPGAWELPIAARWLVSTERYDGIVAVGAVIRGETAHFDYIAGEASRGLAAISAEFETPVGFGVLTCDTDEQAEARAGGAHGNKGWDAAVATLEMVDLYNRLAPDDAD